MKQLLRPSALMCLTMLLAMAVFLPSIPVAAEQKGDKKKDEKEKKAEPYKVEKLTQGFDLQATGPVSPDRELILLIGQKPEAAPNLYVMNLKDFAISSPMTDFKWGIADPAWSPDSSSVAVAGFDESGSFSEIYVLNFDTQKKRRLTDNNFSDKEPVFLPDGKRLLYTTDESPLPDAAFGILHIGAIAVGGGKSEYFTEDETSSIKPGVTADGKSALLVKIDELSGRHSLWQYGFDGKPLNNLTGRKFARILKYIPHSAGSFIVFWAQEEPEQQDGIYILDLKNKEINPLPDPDLPKRRPTVSPNGKRIAFIGLAGEGGQLFLFEVESGELKQLTFKSLHTHSPVFISDDRILFGSIRDNKASELYLLDLASPTPEDEKKK